MIWLKSNKNVEINPWAVLLLFPLQFWKVIKGICQQKIDQHNKSSVLRKIVREQVAY